MHDQTLAEQLLRTMGGPGLFLLGFAIFTLLCVLIVAGGFLIAKAMESVVILFRGYPAKGIINSEDDEDEIDEDDLTRV